MDPEPAAATWATKTDVHKIPATSFEQKAVASNGGPMKGNNHQTHLTMSDADDDDDDIEIIYEGKAKDTPKAHVSAANGQEAPEAMDLSDISESKPNQNTEPAIQLSKRQQEEAAKLAEQRKRFDNQRYQQNLGASNTAPVATAAGTQPIMTQAEPRHEPHQVMGLNFTEVRQGPEDRFIDDLPPGAIFGDTPRAEMPKPIKSRNNHDVFDDDDEHFMQEILDTCG